MYIYRHGYSEGLKAFVEQPEDLVDDVASLLNFLYDVHTDLNRSGFNSHPSALTDVNETFDPFYSLIANSVPFYLFGMSMGGGTALQMGLNLQAATEVPHASLFQGCILLAPAIETRLPSALTTLVFEHIMVPLFPDVCMPASVGGKNHEAVWDSQDFITYVSEKDNYDPENNPHGMSFNNPIRYGTASSILKLMAGVMGHLGSVAFPFLIFHDPEDNVTMYSGSQQLYERSATLPQNKRLIAMSNGKHDLIINRLAFVVEKSFEWIASHDNCHWRGCSGVGITTDNNNSNNGSISSKSSNHRKSVGIFGTAVGASPRTTKRKQAGTAQMDIASTANVNSNAAAGLQTGPVPIAVEPVAAAPEPVARRVRTRRIKQ